MEVVLVTESYFGCTAALGASMAAALDGAPAREAVREALGDRVRVEVHEVSRAPRDLRAADLVVVGAPTHLGGLDTAVSRWLHAQYWGDPRQPHRRRRPHGRPAPRVSARAWLAVVRLRPGAAVAVFDTRTSRRLPGTAAGALARTLRRRGARLVVPPEGFVVDGVTGPLPPDELARAAAWVVSAVLAAVASREPAGAPDRVEGLCAAPVVEVEDRFRR